MQGLKVLELLITPIVRYCVRHSHSLQDFIEVAKIAFVKAAVEEIQESGDKVNVTRISLLTGLYRNEVKRIYKEEDVKPKESKSEISRVIGLWRHGESFKTRAGKPRILSKEEFAELVKGVSKNLAPGSVEFELKRMGFIEDAPRGIKLRMEAHGFEHDTEGGLSLLANDLSTIVEAVEENLFERKEISNLHIRTEYDNIAKKDLETIRQWFIDRGKAFHREARNFLSQFDNDINPRVEDSEAGATVVLGAFSYTDWPQDRNITSKKEVISAG